MRMMFLNSITDGGDNRLRLNVCYAEGGPLPRQILGKHIDEISKMPIEYKKVTHYEMLWNRYLTFAVRDETYASIDKSEVFAGQAVRRFTRSRLLSSLPNIIQTIDLLPALPIHFGIYCLNHIVDVLAYEEPVVRELGES